MERGPFTYKVTYWNDVKRKLDTACGLLFATTFAEAVSVLEDYYELDTIDHLFGWEPDNLVELSESTMLRIENGKDLEEPDEIVKNRETVSE
jgi:hypothetical protein